MKLVNKIAARILEWAVNHALKRTALDTHLEAEAIYESIWPKHAYYRQETLGQLVAAITKARQDGYFQAVDDLLSEPTKEDLEQGAALKASMLETIRSYEKVGAAMTGFGTAFKSNQNFRKGDE